MILHKIHKYFGVGSVTNRESRNICVYRVTKVEDLKRVIIPHFTCYPLISKKYSTRVRRIEHLPLILKITKLPLF